MGIWTLAVVIIIADQISKIFVVASMNLGESISILPGLFHITYSENPGAAFGIMAYRTNFFIIVTLILLVVIGVLMIKLGKEYRLLKVGLALQFGGAVGNFIDRLRTGYVVDFFDFAFWPIFNVADIAIVAGVIILIFYIIFEPYKEEEKNVY